MMNVAGAAEEALANRSGLRTALTVIDWGLWVALRPVKMMLGKGYRRVEGPLIASLTRRFQRAGYGSESAAGGLGAPMLATLAFGGVAGVLRLAQGVGRFLGVGRAGQAESNDPASRSMNSERLRCQLAVQQIAGGHAYDEHVLGIGSPIVREFDDLGIDSRETFAAHIERTLGNATHRGTLGEIDPMHMTQVRIRSSCGTPTAQTGAQLTGSNGPDIVTCWTISGACGDR